MIIMLVISVLSSCEPLKEETLNFPIPLDINAQSAKQIIELADPIINDFWGKCTYSIGEISMRIEPNNSSMRITIIDNSQPYPKEVPRMADIFINITERVIIRISEIPRHSKLYTGKTNFNNWKIDSIEAVRISDNLFTQTDFKYDYIHVRGIPALFSNQDGWIVKYVNLEKMTNNICKINPFTGQILDNGTINIPHSDN